MQVQGGNPTLLQYKLCISDHKEIQEIGFTSIRNRLPKPHSNLDKSKMEKNQT